MQKSLLRTKNGTQKLYEKHTSVTCTCSGINLIRHCILMT